MGDKDHLATPEEIAKNQRRDLKKVVSSIFQGNPPTLTRDVTSIGNVARTTGEVRDTAFPVLADIDDLTDNVQTVVVGAVATITVGLDKANAQFQRLKLDDNAAAITSFIIDFVGLAKNKALEFIADIETIFTGTPTIDFQENGNPLTLIGLPAAFGDTGTNEFKLQISAIDTPIVKSYEVLNGAAAGGVSFPIIPPVSVRGNVNTTQDIDLSATVAHSTTMILTGDIGITFSNFPATANQIEWEVEIKQDGTGGHSITSWPAAVISIPTINQDADAITLVVFRTNDNGTTINTLFSSLGSVSTVSDWANFTAVTNVNVGNFDILAVKDLDFDDPNSTIKGIKNIQFFDDFPNKTIGSVAAAIEYKVPTLESHIFFVGGVEVARFTETAGPVSVLDMLGNRIRNTGDISFNLAGGDIIINRFSMEWDGALGANGSARINVPSNSEFRFQDNGVDGIIFSPFAALGYEIQGVLAINLVDTTIFPATNGEIQLNGADVYIYSGGVARNISDIVGGSEFVDDVFRIIGSVDATKKAAFEVDGFTTTTTRTFTLPNANGNVFITPAFETLDMNSEILDDVSRINQDGTVPTSGFINMANSAVLAWEASPAGADGTLTFSASEFFTFGGAAAYSVIHSNGASLGLSGFRWGTFFGLGVDVTGPLVVDGNTILGDTPASDTLTVNATSTFNNDVQLSDNDITDVNNLSITTAAGADIGSIRGIDASTDILEIRLGAAVDFAVTDNGTVRLEFINALLSWNFAGSNLVKLPQETQISDRASAPSTPPSGFMSLYVINVAGAQTFKVKFDNGTEKDIADDT